MAFENKYTKMVEDNKERLFELMKELIKIDSQNFGETGKEKEIAEKICEMTERSGLECEV